MRRAVALIAAFAFTILPCVVKAQEPTANAVAPTEKWTRIWIGNPRIRAAVVGALEGASDWLQNPQCQAVAGEFSDQQGRPLTDRLTALNVDLRDYLQLVIWRDGSARHACKTRERVAVTEPGSRMVYICSDNFAEEWTRFPRRARAAAIHEGLHTLGLGENPPSPREITNRVLTACGSPVATTPR